jgi:hypothetical protein
MSKFALLGLVLMVPVAAAAQTRDTIATVQVDATASVEREPDRAVLTLAVESEASTAQAASQGNAEVMTRVMAALRQAGLQGPAVRTLSIQLHPVYSPVGPNRQDPPKITGYRAVNMVQATIDSIPRVGRVIDRAIGAGANRVAGLSFELEDPQAARVVALTMAVERARMEAEAVARAAGRRLGPAIEIVVSSPQYAPRPMYADRAMAMQSADTPVEGGTISITATVHVVYRLDPS